MKVLKRIITCRNTIISIPLFLIALLFILTLLIFKSLIFERYQGQIFTASLREVISSSTTLVDSPFSNLLNTTHFDLSSTIDVIISTTGVILAAIIGVKSSGGANNAKKEEKKRKEQGTILGDTKLKTVREYADDYRQKLLNDSLVTTIQILTMSYPLQITKMVQLRVSPQEMSIEELQEDTNGNSLNNRMKNAMEPEKAIIAYNKRCVIVGDPGSGKTTLLKYFAVKSANKELPGLPDLPIYIELNKFASSGKSDLLDYASSQWEEKYNIPKDKALQCIKENLRKGDVLLLLDALNETATGGSFEETEASYKRAVLAIENIGNQVPIIVTTRKADYLQRPLQNGFTKLEVLDFLPEDVREFINRWFADHPDQYKKEKAAADLNSIIERNPRIQTLARNPLMLAEIIIVYEEDMQLPQDRAKLYDSCVDILLTKWNTISHMQSPRQFTIDNKQNLLEEIAWHFHLSGLRYFPVGELLRVIADFLPAMNLEPDQNLLILNAIASEHGLLKEYAKGWYGFLHVTMQEFFVAQQIQGQDKINLLLTHCDEPWWEEVLLLHAVYSRDASTLLERLLERGNKLGLQKDIFYTNLLLAGRCRATHAVTKNIQVTEDIINALFNVLLNTQYSLSRHQVAEILAEIGGTNVNYRLLSILSDNNTPVNIQITIAEALGRVGEPSLAPRLLLILNENITAYNDVLKHVVGALGKMGGDSIARSLLLCLQRPTIQDEVGEAIVDALGKLGASGKLEEGEKITSDLFQLLSRKQLNPYIRSRIAISLGRFGDRSLAPRLVRLLSEGSLEVLVRMRLVDALGMLGEPSIIERLETLLSNSRLDLGLRISIVDALRTLGEYNDAYKPNIIRRLQELLLGQSKNPDICGHVAIALGILGDRSEAEIMLNLLLQPDIDTFFGQSIVNALGKFVKRSSSSEPAQKISTQLLALLFNSKTNPQIRIRIADFMGILGDRIQTSQITDLLSILGDFTVDSQVREAIVDVLGRLGEQIVAKDLFHLLSYPNIEFNICGHIAYVLCILRYENAFPLVLKFLSETNVDLQIRWLIADSLRALGERIQPSELIPLLVKAEIDFTVRQRIADVLAELVNDEESVLELATLLQSSDIADDIHRILWEISRRMGVRIVMHNQGPEIIRWSDEFDG